MRAGRGERKNIGGNRRFAFKGGQINEWERLISKSSRQDKKREYFIDGNHFWDVKQTVDLVWPEFEPKKRVWTKNKASWKRIWEEYRTVKYLSSGLSEKTWNVDP